MKVVSITEVRQDATKVIRHAQENGEPVLVVQRSRPAAYVVGAAQYEALLAALKQLRREAVVRDVEEALTAIERGEVREYTDVRELMASIEAEIAAGNAAEE